MQPDLIGGRYRVERAIGQGGMGTVWLCRDTTLERDVAVKQVGLLPGESVPDSARALREARSSAALGHRNVVTVFDIVEEQGAVWMVMEYVPSRTLSELLKEKGRLAPAEVAAIGAQVADGLAAAHAAGTTHRDVKPGNILIREDGVAKIGDFGIARTSGDPALTSASLVTGTPHYFAPELATGSDSGPASDVWALGASLYAAVEGRPPYRAQTNPMAVLHEIAQHPPAPPQHAGVLEPALKRMLDRDPRSRWSMTDAAHGLHRIAEAQTERTREQTAAFPAAGAGAAGAAGAAAAGSSDDPASAGGAGAAGAAGGAGAAAGGAGADHLRGLEPEPRRRRRRPGPALLAALALLLLIGGLVGFSLLDGGSDDPAASEKPVTPSPTAKKSSKKPSPSPSSSAPEPTQDATTSAPTPSTPTKTATSAPPPAGNGSQASFLQAYYATVPADTDAGWAMLGPDEQSVGRDSYDGFWATYQSVRPSDIQLLDGNAAEVTLTYTQDDGGVVVERQRLQLIPDGEGGWLINDDTVLSSRSG